MSGLMHPLESIRAVTFDVGGTLIKPWPSVGHVYAAVAAQHGIRVAARDLDGRFAAAWESKIHFDYSRSAWAELVRETFCGLTAEVPDEALFAALYRRFASPAAWRIYPEVKPALAALRRQGLKLAVISNWDERLRPLLHRLQLDRLFHAILISAEIGAAKPSPIIFQQALERLGLPAQAVLHVGDSLVEDVTGARTAGLRALLLRRKGDEPTQMRGDRITSLLALTASN